MPVEVRCSNCNGLILNVGWPSKRVECAIKRLKRAKVIICPYCSTKLKFEVAGIEIESL